MYGKIRGALGVSKCVVSGGGSLQPHLDEFYEVLDLTVLNGWGLSEVEHPTGISACNPAAFPAAAAASLNTAEV